jgi:hypothetical protein
MHTLERLWPYHDGPAHIVVGDHNFEDVHIRWCIAQIDGGETYSDLEPWHPRLAATKAVLEFMLTIPEDDRLEVVESGRIYAIKHE